MKILKEKNKKDKKLNKTLTIAISTIFSISLITVISIIINNDKSTENNIDYQEYEKINEHYKAASIEYNFEDYKKDKEAKTQDQKSNATKQLIEKNNNKLSNLEESIGFKIDNNELMESLEKQTKDMNNFIQNHLGWPDDKYGEKYNGVKSYCDDLVEACVSGKEPPNYFELSVEDQKASVRFSISSLIQYESGFDTTHYNEILLNYMKLNYPILDNITNISIEEGNGKYFDNIFENNLNAYIVSNGKNYKIYLCSQIDENNNHLFKILDVMEV